VKGLGLLSLESLIYRFPAIVLALTLHEYAHGRAAFAFGDPTAKNAGRLTLNPLRHLDIIGTLMLIMFGFGWAKPVPVNPYYFQGDRRKKVMYVSAAGPASNLLQALLVAVLLSLLVHLLPPGKNLFSSWFLNFLYYLIFINILLAVFNLLPVPPLDGSKILAGFLSERYGNIIYQMERYGFIILIIAMWLGLFRVIISPIVEFIFQGIMRLVGLF